MQNKDVTALYLGGNQFVKYADMKSLFDLVGKQLTFTASSQPFDRVDGKQVSRSDLFEFVPEYGGLRKMAISVAVDKLGDFYAGFIWDMDYSAQSKYNIIKMPNTSGGSYIGVIIWIKVKTLIGGG